MLKYIMTIPLLACCACTPQQRNVTVETVTTIEHRLDPNGHEIEIKTARGEIKY